MPNVAVPTTNFSPTSRVATVPAETGLPSSRTTRMFAACLPSVWPLRSPSRVIVTPK